MHSVRSPLQNRMTVLLGGLFLISNVEASEFNLDFLNNSGAIPAIFNQNVNYPAGVYLIDVYLNGRFINKSRLSISEEEEELNRLCLSQNWLDDVGVSFKRDLYADVFNAPLKCYELGNNAHTLVDFDYGSQALRFSVPQAYLLDGQRDVDWDYGIDGSKLTYFANFNKSSSDDFSGFGNVDLDINMGRWVLSSDMNVSKSGGEGVDFTAGELTVSRSIKSIKSDFTIGYSQTQSQNFSDFSFYGVALRSNRGMHARSSRGYAPVINGVAESVSRITVTQGGYVIHSEVVAQGPYQLNDISPVSNGDITVTLAGESGIETSKVYPVATLPTLLRAGQYDYNLVIGERNSSADIEQAFSSGSGAFALVSVNYGFEAITLNAAAIAHAEYQSVGFGLSKSLGVFGAVEGSLASSRARYVNGEDIGGVSVGMKYAKDFSDRTNLQLLTYRYQSEGYVEFNEFDAEYAYEYDKRKSRYEARLAHRFDNVYVNGSYWSQNYWSKGGNETGASVSMNMQVFDEKVSVYFNGSYTKSTDDDKGDYSVTLGMSVPFNLGSQRLHSNSSLSHNGGGASLNSSVSSTVNDRLSYNLGVNANDDNSQNITASANYAFDTIQTNLSMSHSNDGGSVSGGISGSLIATPDSGLLFTKQSAETLAIVKIKDIAGVTFNGSLPTNDTGHTVVSLSDYVMNSIDVNTENVPNGIELLNSSFSVRPTEKAIIYREFKTESVQRYIIRLKDKYGNVITSGNAITKQGQNVGFVSNSGVLLLNLVMVPENISIINNNLTCQFLMTGIKANAYELQEVECE